VSAVPVSWLPAESRRYGTGVVRQSSMVKHAPSLVVGVSLRLMACLFARDIGGRLLFSFLGRNKSVAHVGIRNGYVSVSGRVFALGDGLFRRSGPCRQSSCDVVEGAGALAKATPPSVRQLSKELRGEFFDSVCCQRISLLLVRRTGGDNGSRASMGAGQPLSRCGAWHGRS